MVKLTCNSLKFLTKNDFRVLTAIEMGMKNHDLGMFRLFDFHQYS
jgi:RIO-like serine/threonine protein kinase